MTRYLYVLMVLGLTLSGCGKETKQAGGSKETPSASARHASSEVIPGSHEDWCDEHQVPETACARCDPSLIPAFKATQDWCDEHGLPESQCRTCDPDLKIARPAKSEGK